MKIARWLWGGFIWTLSIAWSLLLFVQATYDKLIFDQGYVERFAEFGYASWFVPVVGVWEAIGCILVFYPRLAAWGAAMWMIEMVGAIATHLITGVGSPYHATRALVIFAIIGAARWKEAMSPAEIWRAVALR